MRERGSEGIACPKGGLSPLSGYPNIVHRPIGRFVVSGRGRRCLLPLGLLLNHRARACITLSPCSEVCTSTVPRSDCALPLTIPNSAEVAFASLTLLFLLPSAVRSLGAVKKEEPDLRGRSSGSSSQKGGIFLYVVSGIAALIPPQRYGSKITYATPQSATKMPHRNKSATHS